MMFLLLFILSVSTSAVAAESIPEAVKESLEKSYGLQCTETPSGLVFSCRDERGNSVLTRSYKLDSDLLEISFSPFLSEGSAKPSLGLLSEEVLGMQLAEDILAWFDSRGFCTRYEEPLIRNPFSPAVKARCVDAYEDVVHLKAIFSEKVSSGRTIRQVSRIRITFDMNE